MDSNSKKATILKEHVDHIETLVRALAQAKVNEFIATPEAKAILNDFLKATGLKQVPPKTVTPAPEKTAVEETKN